MEVWSLPFLSGNGEVKSPQPCHHTTDVRTVLPQAQSYGVKMTKRYHLAEDYKPKSEPFFVKS